MAREILFKAKRIDNGEWIEGYYFKTYGCRNGVRNDCHIIHEYEEDENYQIDIDTLCQYTGLTDKNGNKIWENDVVEFEDVGEEGYEYKEGFDFTNRAKVEFAEARWSLTDFIDINSSVVEEMYNQDEFKDFWQYCKVVGNILDNPELLGGWRVMNWELIQKLMNCFPRSFINQNGEFIAHLKANEYFRLDNCESELDVKCKVLEWFSQGAYKREPYRTKKLNDEFHKFMLDGINEFLGTDFDTMDIEQIYTYLGNACNHKKTIMFIESGYCMEALTYKSEVADSE